MYFMQLLRLRHSYRVQFLHNKKLKDFLVESEIAQQHPSSLSIFLYFLIMKGEEIRRIELVLRRLFILLSFLVVVVKQEERTTDRKRID